MFTFFKSCQMQLDRTSAASTAKGEALAGEGEVSKTCSPDLVAGLLLICCTYLYKEEMPDAPSSHCPSALQGEVKLQCKAKKDVEIWQAKQELHKRANAKKDNLSSGFSRQMVFSTICQHQFPSARTLHSSSTFKEAKVIQLWTKTNNSCDL